MYSHALNIMVLSRRQKTYSFLKKREAWWVVIGIDWLAIPVTLFLQKYFPNKISPNDISIFSLLLFVIGLFVLYLDKNTILASMLFYLSTVFDCVDGKLARLNANGGKYGAVVDATVDGIIHSIGFIFIAFWVRDNLDGVLSFLIILFYSFYILRIHVADVTNILSGAPKNIPASQAISNASLCGRFTLNRGLALNPVSDTELSFLVIPLLVINQNNPDMMMVVIFIVFFGLKFMRNFVKNKHNSLPNH